MALILMVFVVAAVAAGVYFLFLDKPAERALPPANPTPPQHNIPPSPAQPTFERDREVVYERQVLVVRCKFCGTLTPVDLAACSKCGAPKFS